MSPSLTDSSCALYDAKPKDPALPDRSLPLQSLLREQQVDGLPLLGGECGVGLNTLVLPFDRDAQGRIVHAADGGAQFPQGKPGVAPRQPQDQRHAGVAVAVAERAGPALEN